MIELIKAFVYMVGVIVTVGPIALAILAVGEQLMPNKKPQNKSQATRNK